LNKIFNFKDLFKKNVVLFGFLALYKLY